MYIIQETLICVNTFLYALIKSIAILIPRPIEEEYIMNQQSRKEGINWQKFRVAVTVAFVAMALVGCVATSEADKVDDPFLPTVGLNVYSFSSATIEGQDAAWAQMRMVAAFTENDATVAVMYMSDGVNAATRGAFAEIQVPNSEKLFEQTGIEARTLDDLVNALADRGVRFFVGKGGLNSRGISTEDLNPIFELTNMEAMAAMILGAEKVLAFAD